jgi:hypothetical protein
MTTENCFENMTLFSTCLTGKNSTNGSPYGSFHQAFFCCNIRPKSAKLPLSCQTAHILGKYPFNDKVKGVLQ